MHITGGQVESQSKHSLEHSEQRINVRRSLPATTGEAQVGNQRSRQPQSHAESNSSGADAPLYDKQLNLLRALVEALTGRSVETIDPDAIPAEAPTSATPPTSTASPGPALRVEATHIEETEITEVRFAGQFSTADGRQLSLELQFSLQRSYSATTFSATVDSGKMKDPLVLNFNGRGAQLAPEQTRFDLDGDGTQEAIATLASGSAYLALDRDRNGSIDNGGELFGARSGDGFAELAKYDSDGNGFIDDADPVFSLLRLFRPGEAMQTLADAGVGAIFLGSAASPARLTDSDNRSLGQLRSTGFYLANAGGAGLVQQLDLAV